MESSGGEQIAPGAARPSSASGAGREREEASASAWLPNETTRETRRDVYFCSTKSGFASDYGRATGVLHLHASNGVCIYEVGMRPHLSAETTGVRRGRSRWWPDGGRVVEDLRVRWWRD